MAKKQRVLYSASFEQDPTFKDFAIVIRRGKREEIRKAGYASKASASRGFKRLAASLLRGERIQLIK